MEELHQPHPPLRLPLLALPLLSACAAIEPIDRPARPNFVLLMADDLGWGELSSRGHPWVRTPELDAMGDAGLVLDRFYAAAPVCSPTRASFLTGRHPNRTGTLAWGHELPEHEFTMAEALANAGYATGHFGKWHIGSVRGGAPTSPGAQGFERWVSAPNFFDLDPLFSDGGEVVRTEGEGSDRMMDSALAFIRDAHAAKRPFLAVLWHGNPHVPHRALAEDLLAQAHVPEGQRAYCAEIAAIDRGVGRLRRELRALGIERETLVWFTSDNGPRPPKHDGEDGVDVRAAATGGLRDIKGTLWEGGIRVPSLIEWPGTIAADSRDTVLSGTVDLFPTVLDLAGVALPSTPLDGTSLASVLHGERLERSGGLGFWVTPVGGRAMHADRMLEVMEAGEVSPDETPPTPDLAFLRSEPLPGHAAWIEGDYKLHVRPEEGRIVHELYDLARDAAETLNLVDQEPERLAAMRASLETWQREVAAELARTLAPAD